MSKDIDIDVEAQNIFDEFSQSEKISEEINLVESQNEKNVFYYLKFANNGLLTVNILIFFSIILMIFYFYVQNGTQKNNYAFLSPICSLFIGDIPLESGTCYGISPLVAEYQAKLEQEKIDQTNKVLILLGEKYAIENFNFSKKVSFLLDKNENRMKPLEILAAFDEIKNNYAPVDKGQISCYNIKISEENIMTLNCDAYSSDWDTGIVTLEEGVRTVLKSGGTSISRAASFINFIENVPNSPFTIIEKTNSLTADSTQIPPYTQKTTFQIQLLYNKLSELNY